MLKNRKNLIITLLIIVGFIGSVSLFGLTSNDSKLMPCYHAQIGSSNSLIQVIKQSNDEISGQLIFQNYQKDSSYGSFVGNFKNNTLVIDYRFQSEGVESNRKITLVKEGENLVGEGFEYIPTDDCKSITYDQGLGLIPFDMKLPLYLFPQFKLQTVDKTELSNTFGSGGLIPFKSLKLMYQPTKGEPVNAVTFFLWYKSVWDVIANPNEAPDWGVMQWSDQTYVFSVNGVQDCVYPNEPDCSNVTEIFKRIYNKNSYISKVPPYLPAEVAVIGTKTFQDPETGFYVSSQFKIKDINSYQSYRCDISALDQNNKVIISWSTEGLSFSPNPNTTYSGQTNITPEQVKLITSSTVKCKVADAID